MLSQSRHHIGDCSKRLIPANFFVHNPLHHSKLAERHVCRTHKRYFINIGNQFFEITLFKTYFAPYHIASCYCSVVGQDSDTPIGFYENITSVLTFYFKRTLYQYVHFFDRYYFHSCFLILIPEENHFPFSQANSRMMAGIQFSAVPSLESPPAEKASTHRMTRKMTTQMVIIVPFIIVCFFVGRCAQNYIKLNPKLYKLNENLYNFIPNFI